MFSPSNLNPNPSPSPNNLNPFLPFTINRDNNDSLLLFTTPSFCLPYSESHHAVRSATINNDISNNTSKKPSLKKERHSKIRTAQGLRDRRVRLSIGIARKFFDLQDTLGFDKASKTLEWLLAKSKSSILELIQTNNLSPTCATSRISEDQTVDIVRPRSNKSSKGAFNNLAKESREKARERARARTRAKLYDKSHAHQVQEISNFQTPRAPTRPHNIIEEPNVLKRKEKSHFGYHQNIDRTITTKEVNSISCNGYVPNLPQSWDISGSITRYSLYAMINTNLSTELHAHGKSSEIIDNNIDQSLQ